MIEEEILYKMALRTMDLIFSRITTVQKGQSPLIKYYITIEKESKIIQAQQIEYENIKGLKLVSNDYILFNGCK